MPLLVWIGLVVLLFALTAGALYVFLRARLAWRTAKSFVPALDGSVRDLTRSLNRLADNAESIRDGTPRLDASVARLQRSVARLNVLRAAVDDARDSLGRITAVYPRK
jgi:hypothetical protein